MMSQTFQYSVSQLDFTIVSNLNLYCFSSDFHGICVIGWFQTCCNFYWASFVSDIVSVIALIVFSD